MHRRITHGDAIGMLGSGQPESEAARDVSERDICQIAIRFREPEISPTWRKTSPSQVIAKTGPDPKINVGDDVIIDLVGSGNLRNKKKRIRRGSICAFYQRE
jgi:hypothetical protein